MLAQMKQTRTLSILLVGDDRHFRAELRTLLSGAYTIVGEASSLETAISQIALQHPDLIILDLKLEGGGDEIAVVQHVREKWEEVKILVLSDHQEGSIICRAMQAGAKGFVYKSQVSEQLENAITTVSRGYEIFPPEVLTSLFRWYRAVHPTVTTLAETPQLSSRQQQVLQLLVLGASNEGIAKNLFITVAAVKAHLDNIFEKLDVTRRIEIKQNNGKKKFETDKLVNSRVLAFLKALELGLVKLR